MGAVEVLAAVPEASIGYGPTIDGVELKDAPWNLAAQGKLAPGVPVIAGEAAEDGDQSLPQEADAEVLKKWIDQTMTSYGANVSTIRLLNELYLAPLPPNTSRPDEGYSDYYWTAKHFLADCQMLCPARRIARWIHQNGQILNKNVRGWVYQFRYAQPASCPAGLGARHAVEIPFVFHVLDGIETKYSLHGEEEIELSAELANLWANFAESGSPNGFNGTMQYDKWPSFDDRESVLLFDIETNGGVRPINSFRSKFCDLWDRIPASVTPIE